METKMAVRKILSFLVSVGIFFSISSCGRKTSSNVAEGHQTFEQQPNRGIYRARLKFLNEKVGLRRPHLLNANAKITVFGDRVHFSVNAKGIHRGTHLQNIFLGSSCPTIADDKNADSFIDINEGHARYDKILIPLDGDLKTQSAGAAFAPKANSYGEYHYSKWVSLNSMLTDLSSQDVDSSEIVVKLSPGEGLNLEGKVIVIHGVPANTKLPDSVSTVTGIPNTASLPIACGVIKRSKLVNKSHYSHRRTSLI